mmetsp:Transcript_2662/g.2832  ORF Transcript_2662/g.2832 Transcript_2662/m.2832 type:complete len:233 (+) Transcript_2662:105-803(+)
MRVTITKSLPNNHKMNNNNNNHLCLNSGITLFQAIVLGDTDVGKTRLIRSANSRQIYSDLPTNGFDFEILDFNFQGESIKLHLWDTPGRASSFDLSMSYTHGKNIVLCVYDDTRRSTFLSSIKRLKLLTEKAEDLTILLVCNNHQGDKQVTVEEGEETARKYGALFFDVSITSTESVVNMITSAVEHTQEKIMMKTSERSPNSSFISTSSSTSPRPVFNAITRVFSRGVFAH